MTTTYDAVSYPTVPRALAHPGHLFAVAKMFGLAPAPVETARVLEIGCGDGGHMLACAAAMPNATFVGFDLSAEAVARGQALVRDAGLGNARIEVGDITTWPPDGAAFDYIVADGIYSWIPAPVREALVALAGRALAPHGVAFFSFNVYPGCYTRKMLWDMMRFHVRGIDDPEKQIDEALRMADFIRVCRHKPDNGSRDLFDRDIDNVLNKRVRNILYHDELSPVNEPAYIHRFAGHLAKHGLRFATEAMPQSMGFTTLPEPVRAKIREYAGGDPIKREQYVDFATLRRFRQSLAVRADRPSATEPVATAIRELFLGAAARHDSIDLAPGAPMTFHVDETSLTIRTPLTKAALVVLAERQPDRLTFDELLAAALARLGLAKASEREVDEMLTDLATAWTTGGVLLKGFRPRFAAAVSDRPVASPLARAQLRSGVMATSILHTTVRFEDPPSRLLVQLLDGTRTVDRIAAELLPLFPPEHRPSPAEFRVGLDRNLAMLAGGGFLVA
jgi:SAM-dependent methyltransferase